MVNKSNSKNIAKFQKPFKEHAIVQQQHLSEIVVTDVRYSEVYFFYTNKLYIIYNITNCIIYTTNMQYSHFGIELTEKRIFPNGKLFWIRIKPLRICF